MKGRSWGLGVDAVGAAVLVIVGPLSTLGRGLYSGIEKAVTALDEAQLRLRGSTPSK